MQEKIGHTIARARRDTVGDAFGRSVARNPEKAAVVFGERRWSYAELASGVNRVANALLARGLEKGDRVAAYGMNSDAYVLLWLGCTRAGMVHVPINFALTGDELLYVLNQSGSKALFYDPALEENVKDVRDGAGTTIHGTLHGGDEFDVLKLAQRGDASEPAVRLEEEDLAQLLYTSGTTAAPKGAMLTHRAFLAHYVSCVGALEHHHDDRVLHSLPFYHSAPTHVFLMPNLLVGATNFVLEKPDLGRCGELIQREGINSVFFPRRSGSLFSGTRLLRSATFPASRRCSTAPRSCPCPCSRSCARGSRTPGSIIATGNPRSRRSPPFCGPKSTAGRGWPPPDVPSSTSRPAS